MNKLRRYFLVSAALIGGGLAVGAGFISNKLSKDGGFKLPAQPGEGSFGAWLTIGKDGIVTVAAANQEMGQGIYSAMAMLAAEELDLDPAMVKVVQAPVHAVYANPTMMLDGLPFKPSDHGPLVTATKWTMDKVLRSAGIMATGGSSSTRNCYDAVRHCAASARAVLLQAAAAKLGKPVSELTTRAGFVVHAASNTKIGFGDIAEAASTLQVSEVALKANDKLTFVGKGMPRVDVADKVDGSALFGIDVRLEGQKYAAIKHCPTFGGTVKSAALAASTKDVQLVKGTHYVATIAANYWQAKQALDAVKVEWDLGVNAALSSAKIFEQYAVALTDAKALTGYETRGDGKIEEALAGSTVKLTADYKVPFLAHATMEPLNCTVQVKDGRCKVWAGNQAPTLVKWMAAKPAGVDSDNVEVITPFLGGGFGRRAEMDFIVEAVEIARQAGGAAVQTIWSREEDMQHDVYRPAVLARFEAGLDEKSEIKAWRSTSAGPSVTKQFTARLNSLMASDMPDKTNVEGASFLPYRLAQLKVQHAAVPIGVPVGFWRSVGHSYNAFFAESFIDECAFAAKADPLAFRLTLLKDSEEPHAKRFAALLQAVSTTSGWGKPLLAKPGFKVGRGIAIAESFHSIVAQVAEVEIDIKNQIRVSKVWAAVDCGLCIDPVNAKAQVSGAIIFGLTAALHGQIDIENGQVKQSNFGNYPLLTMAQCPQIDVQFIASGAEMGGIGEIGTPPIAPAVANAVFNATGKRLRNLPLVLG